MSQKIKRDGRAVLFAVVELLAVSGFAKFVLHMRRICYFQAFGKYSDIAIRFSRFSNPDFLKETRPILATRRLSQVFSWVKPGFAENRCAMVHRHMNTKIYKIVYTNKFRLYFLEKIRITCWSLCKIYKFLRSKKKQRTFFAVFRCTERDIAANKRISRTFHT